jgi:hypothetical protein
MNVNDLVVSGMWAGQAETVVRSPIDKVLTTGTTLTLTQKDHAGKVICFNNLAGTTVTLPAATGSGDVYSFTTTTLATSNSNIVKVANASDVIAGALTVVDNADGTTTTFGTVAASDTITLNRTTTGGVRKGEFFVLVDVAANAWSVRGMVVATGVEATPFSATV